MDCYDACQAEVVDGKVKGSKENTVTNGKLCINFAQLLKEDNLKTSIFENKDPKNAIIELMTRDSKNEWYS